MITKKQIQHIAKLARISLTSEEEKKLGKELSSILDYVAKLEEVDTQDVKPSFQSVKQVLNSDPLISVRQDKVEIEDIAEAKILTEMAPEKKQGYIKIKNVFEK